MVRQQYQRGPTGNLSEDPEDLLRKSASDGTKMIKRVNSVNNGTYYNYLSC